MEMNWVITISVNFALWTKISSDTFTNRPSFADSCFSKNLKKKWLLKKCKHFKCSDEYFTRLSVWWVMFLKSVACYIIEKHRLGQKFIFYYWIIVVPLKLYQLKLWQHPKQITFGDHNLRRIITMIMLVWGL